MTKTTTKPKQPKTGIKSKKGREPVVKVEDSKEDFDSRGKDDDNNG